MLKGIAILGVQGKGDRNPKNQFLILRILYQ
jgi:hypothetical protein